MENVEGGRIATAHLLDHGARAVAVLGGALSGGESLQTLRTRGCVEAHAERGLELRPELIVETGLDMTDGYRATVALLDAGIAFDAVFALTDSCAFGALRALADHGVPVPQAVQVVGFDNVRAGEFMTPRLTTVEPGNDQMADEIVSLMLPRLRSDAAPDEPRRVIAAARLVERETTR
jgi:DNA-binding LacI/PurR family transcriptional regulator